MEEFRNLDRDIEGSAKRWKKLAESEAPEKEKLPQEWKNKNALQRLCILRALRPDRMTYAVRCVGISTLRDTHSAAASMLQTSERHPGSGKC